MAEFGKRYDILAQTKDFLAECEDEKYYPVFLSVETIEKIASSLSRTSNLKRYISDEVDPTQTSDVVLSRKLNSLVEKIDISSSGTEVLLNGVDMDTINSMFDVSYQRPQKQQTDEHTENFFSLSTAYQEYEQVKNQVVKMSLLLSMKSVNEAFIRAGGSPRPVYLSYFGRDRA